MGLPEREALKIQDLWTRDEIGLELSVEVQAPVVVGIYPMRIARYVMEGNPSGQHANGQHANGQHVGPPNPTGEAAHRGQAPSNGQAPRPAEAPVSRPPQQAAHPDH